MKTNIIWVLEEKEKNDKAWFPIEIHETRKKARAGQKWFQEHNAGLPFAPKYRVVKYVSLGGAE